jgi:hypothetical protein
MSLFAFAPLTRGERAKRAGAWLCNESRMRRLFVSVLVALASPASADTLPAGCHDLTPDARAKVDALDRFFTEAAALEAQAELSRRLVAPLAEFQPRSPETGELTLAVEGWLAKKQQLSKDARKEKPFDASFDYCVFLKKRAGIP